MKFLLIGSCKIGRNCTSTIKATCNKDGKVVAYVNYTHYGHDKELEHIWIPKGKRQEVAAKLQSGIKKEKIIEDIRESVSETFSRHHLIDKTDLKNIENAFGLKDIQRHANDQTSVLSWINEWENSDSNPVLFYKLQGDKAPDGVDLCDEDFMIIVQSDMQKHMACTFSSKGICCDSTHGTNGYDFLLTTVMAIDEFGEGFPIAWCLSNHEDFSTLCIFLEEVKTNCGMLTPNWFMSDCAEQFYHAWTAVFRGSPIKLLCTWHVDKAWKKELKEKVKDRQIEADVYKMLRTVMEQPTEEQMESHSKILEEKLSNDKTRDFLEYFKKGWMAKKSQWAYYYRAGLGINTNMFVEAFHKVFKYQYLNGKVNKRVDVCLVNLMKYTRDKTFTRAIKLTKGKQTARRRIIIKRHNASTKLEKSSVVQKKGTTNQWKVQSASEAGKSYAVVRNGETCKKLDCMLRCRDCNICIHEFDCSCPDSLLNSTICKHIHLVKQCIDDTNKSEDMLNHDHSEQEKEISNELEVLASIVQSKQYSDIKLMKEKTQNTLCRLSNFVAASEDVNALKQLTTQLAAAESTFATLVSRQPIPIIKQEINCPAHTNIKVQRRFYSTKMKRNNPKVKLACPTEQEKERLFKEDYVLQCTSTCAQEENNTQNKSKAQQELLSLLVKKSSKAIGSGKQISVGDLNISPAPDVLNYSIDDVRNLFSNESWKLVQDSVAKLKEEWRCDICLTSKYVNMIECESCDSWVGWDCAKISEEPDTWTCRNCKTLKATRLV